MSGGQPSGSFSLPSTPITGNHITVAIGKLPSGVDNIIIDTLLMTDACGRLTTYDPGTSCVLLQVVPVDGGNAWAAMCATIPC
jgi:hypothetical protein